MGALVLYTLIEQYNGRIINRGFLLPCLNQNYSASDSKNKTLA